MCCPKNTLICKLELVYRYNVYNEKPVYGHFTQNEKINNFYTKFGKKKKNKSLRLKIIGDLKNQLFLPMHVHLCILIF